MKKVGSATDRRAGVSGAYVALFFGMAIFAVVLVTVRAQPGVMVDQKTEGAILAQDWVTVSDALGPDDSLASSPVARFIKGHAYLALNRNNESLCLFLSVTSEDDLKKWKEWTGEFAKQNPKSPIAHYFEGDAFARLEQWDSALVVLDNGLELDSSHALILNARGVSQAARGKWDTAYVYLTKAIVANDSFADAYASMGAMWIQRRTGAKGALDAFNQALRISPDFALALNGRGCAQFALGHWDSAQVDFEAASKKSDCLSLTNLNLLGLNKATVELMASEIDELAKDTAGMSLDRKTRLMDLRSDIAFNRRQIASIQGAQKRIDSLWKPFWHGVSGLPWVGGAGRGMLEHLENRTRINEKSLSQFHGSTGRGVETESVRRAYVDSGNWPVVTWAGLTYYVKPSGVSLTERSERK